MQPPGSHLKAHLSFLIKAYQLRVQKGINTTMESELRSVVVGPYTVATHDRRRGHSKPIQKLNLSCQKQVFPQLRPSEIHIQHLSTESAI
jgi:hypothetical protein